MRIYNSKKQPMEGRPNAYHHFRSAGKGWGLTDHYGTRKQCDRLIDRRPNDFAINRPGPQPLGYWKRATQS
jgi:hypothetical protein